MKFPRSQSRGQLNIEFLAAAGFYLIAMGAVITAGSSILPQYSQEADKASLNLEARSFTNKILTEPGSHNFGGGGSDWESTPDTVQNIESFGLASDFLQVQRDKIQGLSTVSTSGQKLNYSQFKNITDVKNQYRFRFTWMPTIQTHQNFIRGNPPSSPPIVEPDHSNYTSADNEVHYGNVELEGESNRFLIVAHNGVYDKAYISDTWDFENSVPREKHESLPDKSYTIHSFQNRERDPGSFLVLNETIKTFGANIDSDSVVIKLERFASMENEPLKIEVWAW